MDGDKHDNHDKNDNQDEIDIAVSGIGMEVKNRNEY